MQLSLLNIVDTGGNENALTLMFKRDKAITKYVCQTGWFSYIKNTLLLVERIIGDYHSKMLIALFDLLGEQVGYNFKHFR